MCLLSGQLEVIYTAAEEGIRKLCGNKALILYFDDRSRGNVLNSQLYAEFSEKAMECMGGCCAQRRSA